MSELKSDLKHWFKVFLTMFIISFPIFSVIHFFYGGGLILGFAVYGGIFLLMVGFILVPFLFQFVFDKLSELLGD